MMQNNRPGIPTHQTLRPMTAMRKEGRWSSLRHTTSGFGRSRWRTHPSSWIVVHHIKDRNRESNWGHTAIKVGHTTGKLCFNKVFRLGLGLNRPKSNESTSTPGRPALPTSGRAKSPPWCWEASWRSSVRRSVAELWSISESSSLESVEMPGMAHDESKLSPKVVPLLRVITMVYVGGRVFSIV